MAAAVGVAACATNPATGRRQISLVSESQEKRMGQQADQEVAASIGLYPETNLQAYVQRIGEGLAAHSERPGLAWTFRLVDDPAVNAFAIPGGYVYVTRGLMSHLTSEAELAAVMGHEIGHVTARHTVSMISKAQLANVGLILGMILRPELQNYGNLAEAGLSVLFLKYSRDAERQADDLGLRYVTRGGYDPRPMADVFTTLERVSATEKKGRVACNVLLRPGKSTGHDMRTSRWSVAGPAGWPPRSIPRVKRMALPPLCGCVCSIHSRPVRRTNAPHPLDGDCFCIDPERCRARLHPVRAVRERGA